MNISPLAVVDPGATIGENVQIDPFAVIEKDVVIGDNCHIFPHAVILNGARIGNNCRIFPGAVIAGIPQDLKFKGEITTAEIGNNTTIRECVTVNRGTASKGKTIVGNDCLIMAYSHVAHDCVVRDHVIIGNASQIAGEVDIDDYAIVSGGTLVHQFSRISKHVMIQGGCPQGTGTGGPGYSIKGEFAQNGFKNGLAHDPGVLSMARAMHPDSAGSQFFIMHEKSPHLDGAYAAFGKIIEGMDVVNKIAETATDFRDRPLEDQRMKKVTVETFGEEYEEPERI